MKNLPGVDEEMNQLILLVMLNKVSRFSCIYNLGICHRIFLLTDLSKFMSIQPLSYHNTKSEVTIMYSFIRGSPLRKGFSPNFRPLSLL